MATSHCPDNWELRHFFIIEGRPRAGRFNSLYDHEVLYLDSEADFVMSNDMYDRSGQLFNNYTSWMHYADRAEPDARIAIYPFKREFQVGSSTINLQSGFCHRLLPSIARTHRRAIHGSSTWARSIASWFTPDQMARAAEGGHASRRRLMLA